MLKKIEKEAQNGIVKFFRRFKLERFINKDASYINKNISRNKSLLFELAKNFTQFLPNFGSRFK